MNFSECYKYQEEGEKKFGRIEWLRTFQKRNREKLERGGADRPKRKPLSPSKKNALYAKQQGKCASCGESYPLSQMTDDHWNVNATDYNNIKNRRLVCRSCNSTKNANSVMEEAKRLNRTAQDLTQQQNQLHEESL